jgi:hypothetical protein
MEQYLNALTDDSPQGAAFARDSAIDAVREVSASSKRAEVEVLLHNLINDRRQKRTLHLAWIGDSWRLVDQAVGPEYGGDLDAVAEDAPATLDEKYVHRVSPEGAIAEVAFLDETSASKCAELERLVSDLVSDNRKLSFEARERLIRIGKPAIPALLNALVPVDFSDRTEIAKANRVIHPLRVITGQSFGFSPGFQNVAIRGSLEEDLKHSVRLWFGWWDRNKDSWEGRDIEKEQKDW